MKLLELLVKQKLIVQLAWGEEVIEFDTEVEENDGTAVYVRPYIHNGSELNINVSPRSGVICNLFTDDPDTNQRISWRNVELTTVRKDNQMLYCLKTNIFNDNAKCEDRRHNERMTIQKNGKLFDGQNPDGVDVIVHDISDNGVSFYAPKSYVPTSNQISLVFTDEIGDKVFEVRCECSVARMVNKSGNSFFGCRVVGENSAFKLYIFMKKISIRKQRAICCFG